MNVFSQVSKKFENSIVSIPITLACIVGLFAGLAATYSDYMSSYYGYQQLPTVKVGTMIWLIATAPQAGQIIFATLFTISIDTSSPKFKANFWYFTIAFLLFIWDSGTDMWFKTAGFTMGGVVTVIAFIETLTVYTLGSEVLLISSLGLLIYMLPLARIQIMLFLGRLFGDSDTPRAAR